MTFSGFLAQILNGVQFGLLLFLIASGLTLIFGVLGIINLAHGSLFMIGAYTAFGVVKATGSLWLALPVGILFGAAVGSLLEVALFRHFYRREHLDQVLLTFALILIFEQLRSIVAGNDFHAVPVPAMLDFSVPITAGFSYSAYRFAVILVCLLLAAVLFWWIERTRMGAIIRAAAEKPEMVDVLGIDPAKVHLAVFAVGTALAVAAGALAAPLTSVYPNMGDGLLIISFVVVVIGGLGSVSGAFWSALLIGLIDTLGKAYGPAFAGMSCKRLLPVLPDLGCGDVIAALAAMAVYIMMVAVLLWRPTGLFGRRA